MNAIADLAFLFGHKLNRDALEAIADVLIDAKWTAQEVSLAARYIPTDEEMCETITYNRTINPTVFAKVKNTEFVKRGRLFEYQEALNFCDEKQETMSKLFDTALCGEKTVFFLR